MPSLQQKAIKSVFWVGSARLLKQAISWCVTIILIRILSPGDYGLMGMAMVYEQFIIIMYDLGLGEAIVQKRNLNEVDIYSAFWFSIIFGIFLFIITLYLAKLCALFFKNDYVTSLIRVLALGMFFLSAQEIPYNLMARRFEFQLIAIAEFFAAIAALTTSLVMAIMGFGVWSLVIGHVSQFFVRSILVLIFAKWRPKLSFCLTNLLQLLKFSLPLTGHYILEYLRKRSDFIMIGRFLGQNILGYYTVAMDLSRIPIDKVITIANKVAFPVFAEIQNNKIELRRYFYKLLYLISLFSFPVLIGMLAISEEIIVLVLTSKWLPSLFAFRIFCIVGIFQSFNGFLLIILKARGKTNAVFRYSLFSAVILPSSFLIAVRFGLSGVAISWLSFSPFLFAYLLYLVSVETKISIIESIKINVTPVFIGSCLMLLTIIILKKSVLINSVPSFFSLFISIFVGVFIYMGYLFMFSKRAFKETKLIANSLKA